MDYSGIRQPSDEPPQCSATMENFYNYVIADVIEKSSEHFLEDGVDLETLAELNTIWTAKLQCNINMAKANASKLHVSKMLLSGPRSCDVCTQRQEIKREFPLMGGIMPSMVKNEPDYGNVKQFKQETLQEFQGIFKTEMEQDEDEPWEEVAYTIPLEVKINTANPPFSITVHVTQDQINGNRIKGLITKEVLNELTHLNIQDATAKMQTLVDEEFKRYMQNSIQQNVHNMPMNGNNMAEFIQVGDVSKNVRQIDGADDDANGYSKGTKVKTEKSDSGDSDDDDDDDDYDDDDDLAAILGEDDNDSEPDPDSNDDITEEEVEDTDNLILCQYTHVKRQKNHWKFRFENGIMIIDGVEYVFQRATGEGIW